MPTNHRQTILASRPAAMVLALSLVAGLSAPFVLLPPVRAAVIVPNGTTELSPAPVEQTQSVPPSIVVTFDDSGSMERDYMGDNRPYDNRSWSSDPWRCAGIVNPTASSGIGATAMNGVYYNPHVDYLPPVNADGTSFPNADKTLKAVWDDGVRANRPLNPGGSSNTTNFTGIKTNSNDYRWECPADDGRYGSSPISSGGPYYYRLKATALATLKTQLDSFGRPTSAGRTTLYTTSNWEAVAVTNTDVIIDGKTVNQWQNWANWWAYYHTRTLMARTAVSRAFGAAALSATNAKGGFGNDMRVTWQELNDSDYKLPGSAIISALIDTAACTTGGSADPKTIQQSGAITTPPDCYRSAFFNWIFSVGASGNTPARAAARRAGEFFKRGDGNKGSTGNLEDPYWQPPPTGTFNASSNPGNELYCRRNYHMLVTDGYWNEAYNYGTTGYNTPDKDLKLPDGTQYSASAAETLIYRDVQGASEYTPSQAVIAFNYWATNLRPDLYTAAKDNGIANPVTPYMPDMTTGVVTGATSEDLEKYFNPNNDPANWPHMSEYMVTLGVPGDLVHSDDLDCKNSPNDACSLRTGANTSQGTKGWPAPQNNDPTGIDDTWNAAINSRGKYFNAGNPQDLVDQLGNILGNIAARGAAPRPAAVNASVATTGALSFNVGHNDDWSGVLQAVTLTDKGKIDAVLWDVGTDLDSRAASDRKIYTAAYKQVTDDTTGTVTSNTFDASFEFTSANSAKLDATETAGLESPAIPTGSTTDTLGNRIDYLRGDDTHELDGTYRSRTNSEGVRHVLGAILRSQPVYVSYPGGNYYNFWPSGSPEIASGAQSYDTFVSEHKDRAGTVYVGANDGMLHAFNAPVPTCTASDTDGKCLTWDKGTDPGKEQWAFVPRAVYANLGNLTNVNDFHFRPTVDGTPVTRDVFFSDQDWHTMLAGGVGVGGRGVYALDITGTANSSTPETAPTKVLWEFDSDMTVSGCTAISGGTEDSSIGCRATDLGYTVSQPNIGRLHNGKWMVLVPNGYFPDCSKDDYPTADKTACAAVAAQAPKYANGHPYSALFVLNAETGDVVAELKTPDLGSDGVYSFGLSTPVLGDYNNDQVDDVAFAGDAEGNLWRFDLSDADPKNWKVTLAYQAPDQGVQPITSMPRLFPDPTTNRFMVVFGTGKYLGADDNGDQAVQSIYGIRDGGASGTAVQHSDLVAQTLAEEVVTDTTSQYYGLTLRKITSAATVPATKGGWYIDLKTTASDGTQTNAGERVVVTPGAIFATNTVVISTLLTGTAGSDPCNPSTQGAIMFIDATTGGPGHGVSSLGGYPYVGARVNNVRTSGSLPTVSALGGGQLFIPGVTLSGNNKPIIGDLPIWRRRSWQEIQQN